MPMTLEPRPCDRCGGAINPCFYVVDINFAAINQRAAREHVGLTVMFGGNEQIANVFRSQDLVTLNEKPELKTQLILCASCYCGPLVLAEQVERRQEAIDAAGRPSCR